MAETIYASFADRALADQAVGALMDYSVRPEDISLIAQEPEPHTARDFAAHTATSAERTPPAVPYDPALHGENLADVRAATARNMAGEPTEAYRDRPEELQAEARAEAAEREAVGQRDRNALRVGSPITTTTPADAAAGAEKGAVFGLGLGFLALLASVFIPGIGLVAGGGALATAIAGALGTTAAGAIAGGVLGYLKDQGVPPEYAEAYEQAYREGGVLLALHMPSGHLDAPLAEAILRKYGGANVGVYGVRPIA